jgi:putative peptidoglycan lipid II flippase
MAVGTVASRTTGFLRTAVIAAVLGAASVGDAFNLANTAPNIVYELLLGGVLSSVVVPLLVRAAKEDGDHGDAYTQRLLTLAVVVLGAASLLLVLFAPLLVDLYASSSTTPETHDLAVVFARFFLPQVLFYGAGAIMGAYLNTRGLFGPPMWAPVLNNLVVIATGVVFLALPGPSALTPGTITDTQVTVLGVGVTLGIVAQTVALLPALHRAGFRFVPRFDLARAGLRQAGSLAKWVFLFVVANQLAYVVVVKLATEAGHDTPGRGYSAYVYAFVLWQLPHAVVGVSVITAVLPRMSRLAAEGRLRDLRRALSQALRLSLAVLVPSALAFVVLGRALATAVFGHLNISVPEARYIGVLLGVFAIGLVPFSVYQLQLRAFYALQDTRTPTLVNLWVNATVVVVDLVLFVTLPDDDRVVGLALGQALSYVLGVCIVTRKLVKRVGGRGGASVVRTLVRCVVAGVPAALVALAIALGVDQLGHGTGPALLTLVAGGTVLVYGYVRTARRLHVPEVEQLVGPVLARLHR